MMLNLMRTSGSVTCLLLVGLWIAFIVQNMDPAYKISSESYLIQVGMVGLAILGLLGFRFDQALIVIFAGLVSFFPIGLYVLGAPSIFRLIGVLDLVVVVLGIFLLVTKISKRFSRPHTAKPNSSA